MKCPNCSSAMREVMYESVPIDICDDCGGTWLDHKELQLITQREIEKIDKALLKQYEHKAGLGSIKDIEKDLGRNLNCPKCKTEMEVVNYSYSSGIALDSCPENCGVFLDKSELEAAQAWAEKSGKNADDLDQYYLALANQARGKVGASLSGGGFRIGEFILGLPSNFANLVFWLKREKRLKK